MGTNISMPEPEEIARFLRDLLDRPVKVGKGKQERIGRKVKGSCGIYRFDDGQLAGAWVCDHGFGASAGAALSLIPAAAAKDLLKSEGMDGALKDNLTEVFNIGASLFNKGSGHVRYTEIVVDDRLPDDVATHLKTSTKRVDISIDISGYSPGWLSVFTF